jgi:hypothetical protein
VRLPALPGDVLISGNLPTELVDQLAPHCKGWLYVNPESDPHFMGETIKSKGSSLKVVPFKPSKDWRDEGKKTISHLFWYFFLVKSIFPSVFMYCFLCLELITFLLDGETMVQNP